MQELQKVLSLTQGDELIDRLKNAGYAFAAWKMPGDALIQLIISLDTVSKIEDFQLSDIEQGFLINTYADNHPLKPFHISADLVIKQDQLSINPNVKASEIDKFKERIDSCSELKNQPDEKVKVSSSEFEGAVKQTVEEIKKGAFEKAVLSRFKDESIPDDFAPWSFFQTICEKYQNAFCSISFIPDRGLWIGASPELLLSENNTRFKTIALAGTKTLDTGQSLSEISWTQKEIEEQALVSRYIINCFKKIRLREFHEHGPKTVQAGNLAHLKTEFIVDYIELPFEGLGNQMLELLHPTSAVCGMPIDVAKPWIKASENYDREFYSGFLGPVNFEGSSDLFVNLRCMKVANDIIRFFAGAGITEGSVPQKELEETEMKMNVLNSLL